VKLDRKTARDFAFAQCRSWGCFYLWKYSSGTIDTITAFLSFILFLLVTEFFYQTIMAIFISKGKA
jgi:hypothetical protein